MSKPQSKAQCTVTMKSFFSGGGVEWREKQLHCFLWRSNPVMLILTQKKYFLKKISDQS